MKTLQLNQGFVALVDDADYERVSAFKWNVLVVRGKVYVRRHEHGPHHNRKVLYLHREILGVTDPRVKVDHRYGDGLDNRRENIRVCSSSQNQMNQKKRSDGLSSQFKGVTARSGKRGVRFQATIKIKGRTNHLGCFGTEIGAALAYDAAAREHFGEFALCNFPPKMPCVGSSPAVHSAPEGIRA